MSAALAEPSLDVAAVLRDITDLELRDQTFRLFQRIRDSDPDVVVLAARRLACLYSALVEAGMARFGCPVFSDRDFELDRASFNGRRIALVDDSLVVGSTLAHHFKMLSKIVGVSGRVEVYAVCVDESQASPAILNELGVIAGCMASSERVSAYSHDLARLLFRNLMPYVGDFLVGPRVALSVSALRSIIELSNWNMADVTSPKVADESTMTYTFLPNDELTSLARGEVLARCPSLKDVDILFKVRIFVRIKGFEVELRVVPMAILGDAPVVTISGAMKELLTHLENVGALPILINESTATTAGRVLQVFCASRIGKLFVADIRHQQNNRKLSFIDGDLTQINFGPALDKLVVSVASLPFSDLGSRSGDEGETETAASGLETGLVEEAHEMTKHVRKLIESLGLPGRPIEGETVFLGQTPVGIIGHWFSFVDGAFERPERLRVRKLNWEDFCRTYPDPHTRRLHQGITLSGLAEMIPGQDRRWARCLASLAIDVCNDTGVAVPATMKLQGKVVRTFRLGENSYLAGFPFAGSGSPLHQDAILLDRDTWLLPRFKTILAAWDANTHGIEPSCQDRSELDQYASEVHRTVEATMGQSQNE